MSGQHQYYTFAQTTDHSTMLPKMTTVLSYKKECVLFANNSVIIVPATMKFCQNFVEILLN